MSSMMGQHGTGGPWRNIYTGEIWKPLPAWLFWLGIIASGLACAFVVVAVAFAPASWH